MTLTLTPLPGLPLIQPGDNLSEIICNTLDCIQGGLQDNDILVLAQKIVSKAEDRLVNLTTVHPSDQANLIAEKTEKDPRFVEMVLQESRKVIRTRPGTLIVEHKYGFICANAGIDHSNVKGSWGNPEDWILLLPENPDKSCECIRSGIEERTGKHVGVMVIDSHGRPWRLGTVGVCIGLSGIPALVDLRGKPDLFGYSLRITQVGAADELAAAASLMMGQADESVPVIHVRGFPYPLREGSFSELVRLEQFDLFR